MELFQEVTSNSHRFETEAYEFSRGYLTTSDITPVVISLVRLATSNSFLSFILLLSTEGLSPVLWLSVVSSTVVVVDDLRRRVRVRVVYHSLTIDTPSQHL